MQSDFFFFTTNMHLNFNIMRPSNTRHLINSTSGLGDASSRMFSEGFYFQRIFNKLESSKLYKVMWAAFKVKFWLHFRFIPSFYSKVQYMYKAFYDQFYNSLEAFLLPILFRTRVNLVRARALLRVLVATLWIHTPGRPARPWTGRPPSPAPSRATTVFPSLVSG